MLRNEYKLSSGEEACVLELVSDMRIAFKYMTARMREKSNIDVVTPADRTQLYRDLEAKAG